MNNGFLEQQVIAQLEKSKLSPQEKKSIKNNLFYKMPVTSKNLSGDLGFYISQYNQMLDMNRQQAILINAQLSVQNGLTQMKEPTDDAEDSPSPSPSPSPSAPPVEATTAPTAEAVPTPSAPPAEATTAPTAEAVPAPPTNIPARPIPGVKEKMDSKYLVGGGDCGDEVYLEKYLKYKAKYYQLRSKMNQ